MVRGMGMGMKVLEMLICEAKTQGAPDEAFAFITRPRFKTNLEHIGKAIAECDWRIPASEMRKLAKKYRTENFDGLSREELEEMTNLCWYGPCVDLGIPYESYCQDPDHGDPAIPTFFLRALQGTTMRYPLIISPFFGPDRQFVVVNWDTGDALFLPGEKIEADKITALSVADCRYFDFDE